MHPILETFRASASSVLNDRWLLGRVEQGDLLQVILTDLLSWPGAISGEAHGWNEGYWRVVDQ